MELIQDIIPQKFIYASGLMILHFIWQAICVAMLLAVVLILFRKSSPQSRYIASVLALISLPITALITCISHLRQFEFISETSAAEINTVIQPLVQSGSPQILDRFISIYINYLPIIVAIWMLGITALLLKSLGQLIIVQRLKHYYLEKLSPELLKLVSNIAKQLGINKQVKAFLSMKAPAPMIIGHFKPVLLIPYATAYKLSDEQIEAVLYHELAHVKRNDYLINIIQNIIEILFFFHPATWWISGIVRKEREECCDVFAIRKEEDKITLAKALATLQEVQLEQPAMAMSILGNNKSLIKRIQNMFTNRPILPSFKEGVIVALFFVFSLSLMSFSAFANSSNENSKNTELITVNAQLESGEHVFAKVDEEGNIQKLFIEGKAIKPKKYTLYQYKIDSLRFQGINANPSHFMSDNEKKILKEKERQFQLMQIEQAQMEEELKEKKEVLRALEEAEKALIKANKEHAEIERNVEVENVLREVQKEIKEANQNAHNQNISNSIDFSSIMEEVFSELGAELGKNANFTIDIEEDGEKVKMYMGEDGFYIDVDEDGEKVKIRINENGMNINVKEDGKTTVDMNLDTNGIQGTVKDSNTTK